MAEGSFMYQPVVAHHDHLYRYPKHSFQSMDIFHCCCQPSSSSQLVFFWLDQEDCARCLDGRDSIFLEPQRFLL